MAGPKANARPATDIWRDVWRVAGSLSVDPRELTLRQLLWMSDGRDRFAWSLASSLMALIANCHKGKGKALTANDFNPTLTKEERLRDAILITDENVELMRDEFKKSFGLHASGFRYEAIDLKPEA